MAVNKIRRTNEDIQRALSALLRNVKDPRIAKAMVSITAVDTTEDLRFCKVYLSVLGEVDEKDFMKGVRSAAGFLRRELGHSLQLRYTPELIFHLDKSIAQGARITGILNSLDIPEDTDDNNQ